MTGQIKLTGASCRYDTMLEICEHLNSELGPLRPWAIKLHLLSSNAAYSALRAGINGSAFRVLTQDIQLLSDQISTCAEAVRLMMNNILLSTSNLTTPVAGAGEDNSLSHMHESANDLAWQYDLNQTLRNLLQSLNQELSSMTTLVKKGEYLAAFSSIEAVNSGAHRIGFEAVAIQLKKLVADLKQLIKQQQQQLKAVIELVDNQHLALMTSMKVA